MGMASVARTVALSVPEAPGLESFEADRSGIGRNSLSTLQLSGTTAE